ncbi:MAG: amidohydrolase family protein [Flavobacteriales bacterium]|jgi:imidazolonepropionase-like amidohydrolase|nr:amidohydrolase family protein [Flavobacteriales bacterium]MBT7656455.1 amidohydrolase family protein [Flavobacteriales bacterium]
MKKLSIFLVLATTVAFSQQTYLHCGAIFDAPKGKLIKEQTIVVEGNKIIQLQKGYIQPTGENTSVIDLKNKTVLPGFIDMHVHIENEYNATSYINQFVDNDADTAYDAALYAQRTLLAGFTTVRDMGGSGVNVSLRDAIAAGKVPGPRIFTAEKAIGTTGGHADPTNGSKKSLMGDPGPAQGVINSPEDGKKAVRQRYKNGADCIKITATGGVLSVAKNGQNPQFTLEEIKSIVSTANDYGMHVAAHAHGDEGMYRAVLGGVTTIEHGTLMSVRTMDLMKEKNAYLVATITAGKQVAEKAKIKGYFPDVVTPKALEIGPQIQDTFGRAYKRGVPIAFGTDAGVYPHGLNALEFGYMVEAGMPEVKALQSATITNARLLKSENELGQIAVGFYADIIATDSNPLEDIKTLESIPFVMKNGLVYKQD